MKDFVDRQPTVEGGRKITYANGTSEEVIVEMADAPAREGTPLDRAAFMALQGFESKTTVFNTDGSITETDSEGSVKTTVFNADGSITETFRGISGLSIQKLTTFNSDGSISEVLI